MAENITNIVAGTKERVAYDLAVRISQAETTGKPSLGRKAMLELYAQCLAATNGGIEAPALS